MLKPDMLVFMSDQHSPIFSSYMGGIARTPNMEKLCEAGTMFSQAYTSSPLCVPARMSMLLGKLPSETGIFTNNDAIPERNATFLHSLVAQGYETVLIGRMHFIGTNQRHGFTKRLVGDITPVSWTNLTEKIREERGAFSDAFGEAGAWKISGGGNSPVLEFDKAVIKEALEYLSQPHEKPQCIVVGTYGPHFPYVAEPELYNYYKQLVEVPETCEKIPEYFNPILIKKSVDLPSDEVKKIRAAYFGMIEMIDRQLGQVRDAFNTFLDKNNRKGVFAYVSDHGDQVGEKKQYGKQTFFETSAKIPLIFEGIGTKKGQIISTPVSIIDLGPTLCEIAGTNPPPMQDGKSLVPTLLEGSMDAERAVICEFIDSRLGMAVIGRMVRKSKYKYITYLGYQEYDLLFDIEADPNETKNIIDEQPEILEELKKIVFTGWDYEKVLERYNSHVVEEKLVKTWNNVVGTDDTERWKNVSEDSKIMPKVQ